MPSQMFYTVCLLHFLNKFTKITLFYKSTLFYIPLILLDLIYHPKVFNPFLRYLVSSLTKNYETSDDLFQILFHAWSTFSF